MAIALAYVKAGNAPNRQIVHALESPLVLIEPGQGAAGRELTPANGEIAIEGKKPGSRTMVDDGGKVGLVVVARSLLVLAADSPVHAPAAVAGALFAEQDFKGGPKFGRQRFDSKFHCGLPTIL